MRRATVTVGECPAQAMLAILLKANRGRAPENGTFGSRAGGGVGAIQGAWHALGVARETLYGYLVGLDLSEIEEAVIATIDDFVARQEWIISTPWSVHEGGSADDDGTSGWRLGFHLQLPDPQDEVPGWFADVESLLQLAV